MTIGLIILAVVLLAYANGANDNFKGVATLFGSGTTDYRRALVWATVSTLVGSIAAVLLAEKLLKNFSGKGLVSADLAATAEYGTAVAVGAGLTVLIAARIGMPISTTHSLVGALIGAGWAAGSAVNFGQLASGFFLPLIVSPFLAVASTFALYPIFRLFRQRLGVTQETCFCVGSEVVDVVPVLSQSAALQHVEKLSASVDDVVTCQQRYQGRVFGFEAARTLDMAHFASAGLVSFARGLNDTPKIAALLLLVPLLGSFASIAVVGIVIAIGGLVSARRVAQTMSLKITSMNHGQGFTANLITAIVVIGASRFGLPVSTTHVSCGSLFGIGTVTRKADPRMIGAILGAWLATLPLAAVLGATTYLLVAEIFSKHVAG